jgi:hypothetical protein
MECSVVDPIKDVQAFIQKNSTFADNDRLRNLYKELNLYQPLGQQLSEEPEKLVSSNHLMNIEKTSRSMA